MGGGSMWNRWDRLDAGDYTDNLTSMVSLFILAHRIRQLTLCHTTLLGCRAYVAMLLWLSLCDILYNDGRIST